MLRVKSQGLVSATCWNTSDQVCMKFSELMDIPKRPLIWLQAMTKAAAEENPAVTGTETNSTRQPERKRRKATLKVM